MKNIFVIALPVILSLTTYPKSQPDSLYQIELSVNASPVISFYQDERYPGGPKNPSVGYGTNIRAMWHPGRLLSFGLMSGYIYVVKDEFTVNTPSAENGKDHAAARLSAVPLQAVISMQKNGLEIGLGMGPYLLLSTIEYGKTANGHRFELGLTLFGSYTFAMGDNITLGPELRMVYLDYRRILSVMPSLNARITLWRY